MPKATDYRLILGRQIREKRKEAGLTIEKLAEKSSLHPNFLGRVERGEEHISLRSLIKIAKSLDVTLSALVVDLEHGE